jgi:hypothetical protein
MARGQPYQIAGQHFAGKQAALDYVRVLHDRYADGKLLLDGDQTFMGEARLCGATARDKVIRRSSMHKRKSRLPGDDEELVRDVPETAIVVGRVTYIHRAGRGTS